MENICTYFFRYILYLYYICYIVYYGNFLSYSGEGFLISFLSVLSLAFSHFSTKLSHIAHLLTTSSYSQAGRVFVQEVQSTIKKKSFTRSRFKCLCAVCFARLFIIFFALLFYLFLSFFLSFCVCFMFI